MRLGAVLLAPLGHSYQREADAIRSMQLQQAQPQVQIVEKPISDFKTADMIMELLGRGYAVIKMPEGGGLPEVLK
jgi:hypothetical protein